MTSAEMLYLLSYSPDLNTIEILFAKTNQWRKKDRNLIERFFKKLKHFRAVATRYDKRADNFLTSISLLPSAPECA